MNVVPGTMPGHYENIMGKQPKSLKQGKQASGPQAKEPLVVFAFRLTAADRDRTHAVADRG